MTKGAPQERYIFRPPTTRHCVIVPVLNEGERIRRQLEAMQPYRDLVDIYIADGGSTDGETSPEALQDKVSGLFINKGKRGLSVQYRVALAYLMEQPYAGFIGVDGNGKDGMDALPRFVGALNEGFDLIQGSRFIPGGHHENTPWDRELAIRYIAAPLFRCASGFRYTDPINGFKGFSRKLLTDPRIQPLRPVFMRYSLQYFLNIESARLGFRVREVPVSRVYPADIPPPSHIKGWQGRARILREIIVACLGFYRPK